MEGSRWRKPPDRAHGDSPRRGGGMESGENFTQSRQGAKKKWWIVRSARDGNGEDCTRRHEKKWGYARRFGNPEGSQRIAGDRRSLRFCHKSKPYLYTGSPQLRPAKISASPS